MRSSRRKKQDARRRQEQEYRNGLIQVPRLLPVENLVPFEADLSHVLVSNDNELDDYAVSVCENRKSIPTVSVSDVPRVGVLKSNWFLIILACTLSMLTLGINASFAWDRGDTVAAKAIMAMLGVVFEAVLFFLPTQASYLWRQRHWLKSIFASILCIFLFAFGLLASIGFASANLTEATTARAERISPALADAERKRDAITASKQAECVKRGDKCRQLEKDEQLAIEGVRTEREKVSATADPQIMSAAKLVAWVSLDRFHPSVDDFAMLRLLLLTLLPQLGGLVLMVSTRRS
jgi:hypothetical protein